MDENLKREVMLDNYLNPANKEIPSDQSYIKVNTNNSSCIDNLDIFVKIKDGIIVDIKFDGEACAISTSSSSIMSKELKGKTILEAKKYIENFHNMIEEQSYDPNMFNEAIVYDEIYKQANRKNCALLPYKGILDALNTYEKEMKNTEF